MQIRSYTFQSPYSQPFQVGKLDPASVKEESPASIDDSKLDTKKENSQSIMSNHGNSALNTSLFNQVESISGIENFKALNTQIQGHNAYFQKE